jgi:adenine deaminase
VGNRSRPACRCLIICLIVALVAGLRASPIAMVATASAAAQNQEFDLLIRGGHVIDPRNNVNAVMDVAVTGSKVALVAANIAPARARQVADATGL